MKKTLRVVGDKDSTPILTGKRRYATIAAVSAAPRVKINTELSWREMLEIAREDALGHQLVTQREP